MLREILAGFFAAGLVSAPLLPNPTWCHLTYTPPPFLLLYTCEGSCADGTDCNTKVAHNGGYTFYSCHCGNNTVSECSGWVMVEDGTGATLPQCLGTDCPVMSPDCEVMVYSNPGDTVCDCIVGPG